MKSPQSDPGGALVDRFGRSVRNLRISVTDRCDLRCAYCMPEEGVRFLPKRDLMGVDEYIRIAQVAVGLGIRRIRLTGGEPLLFPDLVSLVERLVSIDGVETLALTTNGTRLAGLAGPLRRAGLHRINVSMDAVDPAHFHRLTRGGQLDDVLGGLRAAEDAGFDSIKVNAVIIRGYNDDAVEALAEFARRRPYEVRFIEYMPLDAGHEWERAKVLSAGKIIERIHRRWPLEAIPRGADRSPAVRYRFADGAGMIGFIASVSEPFCDSCDRIRVTAEGKIKTCLFGLDETDLSGPMAEGASDEELGDIFRSAVLGKWAGHAINTAEFIQPERSMSSIGG